MRDQRRTIDFTFYETYHFAHLVKNVLSDQFSYIRKLNEFYGDGSVHGYVAPFPRWTAFHSFIEFVLTDVISEEAGEVDLERRQKDLERFKDLPSGLDPHPARLPIELAMERFQVPHASFENWLSTERDGRTFLEANEQDVDEYYDELRLGGEFGEFISRASREVFFVLFQNRNVLLLFNDMMARAISDAAGEHEADVDQYFQRGGVLKRVGIPRWVQKAVFFRDRGRCVLCDCDLSGLVSSWADENFDHIVPRAAGGLNDCTNIQLLCGPCNSKKSAGEPITSSRYEAWFDDRQDE